MHLLRASSDAMHSETVTQGSYYAVVLKKTSYSTAALSVYKRVSGTLTLLATTNFGILPGGGQLMRTVIRGNGTIYSYVNGVRYHKVTDTSLTSGQPGVGGYGFAPGGWYGVQQLQLGPLDRVAPGAVSSTGFAVTALANTVDMQWVPTVDDANGVGVASYNVYRNSSFVGETPQPEFSDAAVSPATAYTHAVEVVDMHGNASNQLTLNVTTAPAGSIEPRRVGVRSEGSYWGGAGEQLDMRSGNLNFTLGLVRAQGRGGWGVPLGLSYNSQNWRKDVATWRFGRDVGYGFGWRLMAGAITPVYSNILTVHHYVFMDATGAEYRLDVNTSGVWTSSQGTYVSYVEATNRLYFNNGSFWEMGALSGGTEDDAGTRYPTRIQDTNGNYVDLRYMTGLNAAYSNSSARIWQVEDVRVASGGSTYTFTYNSDPIPHLTGIANSISTAETYSFTYTTAATLTAPFAGSGSFGNAQMLQVVTQTGPSLSHTFEYGANGAGELTKAIFPYQGELRWTHTEFTYTGNRTVREVTSRQVVKQSGATPWTYTISHPSGDTAFSSRSQATLDDASATGQRVWYFTTATGFTHGLVWMFEQKHMPGAVVKRRQEYTWVQDGNGRPYIGTVLATADPGQSYQKQSKTEQTLSAYGNVTQRKEYAYGNLSTPARTYNNTYLSSGTYVNAYVRNRLSTAQVTNGTQTATLATITYDTYYPDNLPTTPQQWVAPGVRGLVSRVVTPSSTRDYRYDQTGTVKRVSDELGRYVERTNSQANDYAVPSAVTPNGDSSMQESFSWNGFLGLTQDSAPNGAVSSITYDANARPQTVTSPHGAVTTYTYTNSPPTVTVTTNQKWVKTTMDGFGRTIKVERGHNNAGGGTKTIVDTEYEACACSPLGKMKRVSLPYAPGGSVLWTTNTYDGLGRTVSVAQPNSSGTSSYLYEGNAVTVTDAAGKWRKYESDAFGNVTKTIEPNPAGGSDWETTYAYDMLGRRTSLTMTRGATTQTRTWNYDGWTGRLASEVHPETGTTSYSYYSDGKLNQKWLANGKFVSYTYDAYGRLATVFDSTSTCNGATFTYDEAGKNAIGRLSKVKYGGENCTMQMPYAPPGYDFVDEYWYSAGGLATKKQFYLEAPSRSYKSQVFEFNYGYNNEGQMTSENLYMGAAQQFSHGYYYDDLGRVLGMTGSPVVTNVSYNAADQMTAINHNGIAETRQYNSLYQLTRITVAGQMDLEYRYSASANNGQITQLKNWISGEEVNYSYDAVGRLSAASTTGTEWGLSFTYDGFGNKTAQTVTKGTAPAMSVGVDANNRVVGWTFDAAGFPTAVAGQYSSMVWDAQGRMLAVSVQGGNVDSSVYDPGNLRVWRNNQLHLRGLDGKVVGLYNFNTSTETFTWVTSYAWFAGRKVGQKIDRLGTVQNGSRFYPYGEESASTGNDTEKFGTYWRDSNSGLDYAVNRYYKANVGRFMSPDPYWGSATLARSGSWNRFAYVEGDPVNANDPSGLNAYDPEFDGPMSKGEIALMSAMNTWEEETLAASRSDVSVADWLGCTLDGVVVPCHLVQTVGAFGAIVQVPHPPLSFGGPSGPPAPSEVPKLPLSGGNNHGQVTQAAVSYDLPGKPTVIYQPVAQTYSTGPTLIYSPLQGPTIRPDPNPPVGILGVGVGFIDPTGSIGVQVGVQVTSDGQLCYLWAYCQGTPGLTGSVWGTVAKKKTIDAVFIGPSYSKTVIVVPNPAYPTTGIGATTVSGGGRIHSAVTIGTIGISGCAGSCIIP